jgi:hypothetical protein
MRVMTPYVSREALFSGNLSMCMTGSIPLSARIFCDWY